MKLAMGSRPNNVPERSSELMRKPADLANYKSGGSGVMFMK